MKNKIVFISIIYSNILLSNVLIKDWKCEKLDKRETISRDEFFIIDTKIELDGRVSFKTCSPKKYYQKNECPGKAFGKVNLRNTPVGKMLCFETEESSCSWGISLDKKFPQWAAQMHVDYFQDISKAVFTRPYRLNCVDTEKNDKDLIQLDYEKFKNLKANRDKKIYSKKIDKLIFVQDHKSPRRVTVSMYDQLWKGSFIHVLSYLDKLVFKRKFRAKKGQKLVVRVMTRIVPLQAGYDRLQVDILDGQNRYRGKLKMPARAYFDGIYVHAAPRVTEKDSSIKRKYIFK